MVRGEALNPFEMQAYGSLSAEFDLLAIGRTRSQYDVDQLEIATTLLPSVGAWRGLSALHRRLPAAMTYPQDRDHLFGFTRAVAGRDLLHAAETVLPVSEQAARTGLPLVLTCWETIAFRYDDNPVLSERKRRVKASTARFLAVTARARDALLAEGVPHALIRTIPAAVDCDRFAPADASPALRARWGVPPGVTALLYIGRLIQEKGVTDLVRAFADMTDRSCHLVFVGNGDQGERLRIAAGALGVVERVHILPGVPYGELPLHYATADVVVVPSLPTPYWEEQFGMVLAEAMACGRPVVACASGAIEEVVGDAAMTYPPYAVGQLTAALNEVTGDADLRARLGWAGRARALALYSTPVVAAQLAALYREVLTR